MALFFVILISISCFYWLVLMANSLHFFHQPFPPGKDCPPVSILKPVRGIDPDAYQNFLSFLKQDYPDYEVVFGVMDPADPAIPLIRRLQSEFPEKRINLVIAQPLGSNQKTAILQSLSQEAKFDIMVLTDSDIRVDPGFLKTIAPYFQDNKVGLVGCLYRTLGKNLWSYIESLLISTFLLPSGILGHRILGLKYAFGAALAVRRSALSDIGGFSSFKDHVADDHEIARLVHQAGWKVMLIPHVVSNHLNSVSRNEFWTRQLRWMKVAFVCHRSAYPGILLTFAFPLALSFAFISLFSPLSLWFLVVAFGVRFAVGVLIADLLGHPQMRKWLFLLPFVDLAFALLWVFAPLSRRFTWRSDDYLILPDGRMVPLLKDEAKEVPRL
ncbi:MAG: glycosyltransferase [Caldiserica bacterium]|jgi:ceramide glucosyltransferase|nr:glycosyltransferase [Caldisericota bacterium]MDH7561990.1 glycosyltransferase [Caldisericota bacterium]